MISVSHKEIKPSKELGFRGVNRDFEAISIAYKSQVFLSLILLLAQAVANLYLPNLNAELINKGVAQGKIGRAHV